LRPILVVLVRDPEGKFKGTCLLTTDLTADASRVAQVALEPGQPKAATGPALRLANQKRGWVPTTSRGFTAPVGRQPRPPAHKPLIAPTLPAPAPGVVM
jgi:hypothetical protein